VAAVVVMVLMILQHSKQTLQISVILTVIFCDHETICQLLMNKLEGNGN